MEKKTSDNKEIHITLLGTGTSTGVPVLACNCHNCTSEDPRDKRLRTSALLTINGCNFVIDSGPDFRTQLLREKVTNIDGIIFTHAHRDHIAGLDDVRAFNYLLNKTINIYASEEVENAIRLEFPYIFRDDDDYFGKPLINIHRILNTPFLLNGFEVTPILVKHHHLDVFGYRFGDLCYITDASFIDESEMKKLAGCRVLILNALRKSRHVSHLSTDEAFRIIEKLNPGLAVITHMSHFMGRYEELVSIFPKPVIPGYDGLRISIVGDKTELHPPKWQVNIF